MENYGYFLGAYIVAWLVIFAYIFSIFIRQKNLRKEIDSLRAELNNKRHKPVV